MITISGLLCNNWVFCSCCETRLICLFPLPYNDEQMVNFFFLIFTLKIPTKNTNHIMHKVVKKCTLHIPKLYYVNKLSCANRKVRFVRLVYSISFIFVLTYFVPNWFQETKIKSKLSSVVEMKLVPGRCFALFVMQIISNRFSRNCLF
jgi:hypothetical protein